MTPAAGWAGCRIVPAAGPLLVRCCPVAAAVKMPRHASGAGRSAACRESRTRHARRAGERRTGRMREASGRSDPTPPAFSARFRAGRGARGQLPQGRAGAPFCARQSRPRRKSCRGGSWPRPAGSARMQGKGWGARTHVWRVCHFAPQLGRRHTSLAGTRTRPQHTLSVSWRWAMHALAWAGASCPSPLIILAGSRPCHASRAHAWA